MGFEFYQEHVLSSSPEYRSVLHDLRDGANRQMLFMHIDVNHELFKPSTLKRMVFEFSCFRLCTDAILFAIEDIPDDPKWERFVKRMGFEFSSRVECTDGRSRRCFVSKKKNNDDFEHSNSDLAAKRALVRTAALS